MICSLSINQIYLFCLQSGYYLDFFVDTLWGHVVNQIHSGNLHANLVSSSQTSGLQLHN